MVTTTTTYWRLFSTAWQERFAYKIGFFLWRFRQLLSTLMSLTIWSVIFASQAEAFAYDRNQMITYIFLVSILQSFILTSALHGLASDIYSGKIASLLLKPMRITTYLSFYELADKLLNISFLIGETVILYLLFQPSFLWPNVIQGLVFASWVVGGVLLNFIVTILFGTIGFWSPDVWGPKFFFFMILDFTAGKLFPLDILPETIQKAVYLTPFPYFAYAQTQLFLGRLSTQEMIINTFGLLAWIIGLGLVTQRVWQHGLKHFTAAGQ